MSTRPASEEYAADAAVTTIGDGETVVLMLHGLGGDRNQPLNLLDSVIDTRLTIVSPDQRAHGETRVIGDAEDFLLDSLADDATALLAARGLAKRPLIVVGISMGAAVALRMLERGAHHLRGALLIRPAFETEPWPPHLRIFGEIAALLRAEGPAGLDTFITSPTYREIADVSAAGAQSLREQFTKPGAVDRVVRLENVPANPSIVWDGVLAPPCPVTIAGALGDPVHPMHTARLWNERVHSELLELPSRDLVPRVHLEASLRATHRAITLWV